MANVFTCRFCGFLLKSIKGYVDHQVFHRHEANSQYPCCVADCKRVFSKYSAFKMHVKGTLYHRHRKNPCETHLDIMPGPYTCDNSNCQKQCTDLRDLIAHLRSHLSKHEMVNCPFANCGKTFPSSTMQMIVEEMNSLHNICS